MADVVDQWLAVLGALLNPVFPAEAILPMRETFGPLLRREFGPAAFSRQTAMAVAEARRFGAVPSWDVLAGVLRQAVREARPVGSGQRAVEATPEPPPAPPDPEAVARVNAMMAEVRARKFKPVFEVFPSGLLDVSLKGDALAAARAAAKKSIHA